MPRTTDELVAGIIEWDPTIPLEPFIFAANELVTERCAAAGYTAERLELIERFLAAHFYTLREPRSVTERAGSVWQTVQSKVDLFLSTSHYGQHAMILDTAGGLKELNEEMQAGKKRTVSLSWIGKDPTSRRTDYVIPEE